MLKNILYKSILPLSAFIICLFVVVVENRSEKHEEEEGHALEAFENWYNQRALPFEQIPNGAFIRASEYIQTKMLKDRNIVGKLTDTSQWVSIGPNNIGGRVLAVAINPISTNIIWAGSASGGLWVSSTTGAGENAWMLVNTGYPTLAVSSIAINPINPDIMYIGTGEIGSIYKRAQVGTPGARSTYGMGVLKSTNGGAAWSLTGLVFTFPEITAIQKVLLNPRNPNTIYAATSEGTYKSIDAGATWSKKHIVLMAMDIVINPVDTTILYAAYGQRNSTANPGLYKSTDAGNNWTMLSGGLPTTNFGRTSLSISPSNPQIIYAGIANASTSQILGLYKTTDAGTTWSQMSTTNYVNAQGWYDNVVAVHPSNPGFVLCAGLDIYKSTDNGTTLNQKSYWYNYYDGVVPAGGPEGTPDYAHADHHAITFEPSNPNTIYFGTDGGVFVSTDGGETFEGRNGGLVTTQFYNGFANADSDSLIAIGGLQDNGTVKFEGTNLWNKVYGGDGGWCAINPVDKNILYEEYVYLDLAKSTNGGLSWFDINAGLVNGSANANFIAPFVISPSNPNILYAGAKNVFKSTNGGTSWAATNGGANLNGTQIACIGVSNKNSDTLIAGTGTGNIGATPLFEIFVSYDGGSTWQNVTSANSLPNRYPTDISFDQNSSLIAYLTYSGYGAPHVFKTSNAGQAWVDISSNLPDIPTQSIVSDPFSPTHLFVGTDLGVFRSLDGGLSWHEYNNGMPPAMVLDLGISKTNRVLRAATFGNGVYERGLPEGLFTTTSIAVNQGWNMISIPLKVDDGRKTILFPDALAQAYEYSNGYIARDTLENRKGYWLKFPLLQNLTITGYPRDIDTVDVVAGWNLIGTISKSVPTSTVVQIPQSNILSSYYSYDASYTIADVLLPGKAYWVKVRENGKLILK
jgi:photosystem II stability/assembly factor-like uncharacterized protein